MNKMKHLKPVAAAVAAMLLAGMSHAGETIQFDNGVNLDWRLTTNYTLSQRLKNPDSVISTSSGVNDGDNNFAKNSLTNNRVSVLFEGKVSKGDSGFVLSGSTFYDDVYHRKTDNTGQVNKPGPASEFSDGAVKYHGGYSRILDAYAYTSFGVGESSRATIRAGRHAVNWGEAVYFPNISMAQGPFDGTKTGVPGTEVKDSILPEDQISGSIELTPRWSLLGQAQFNFHPTIAAAPGSYLSSSDGVGPGGSCLGPYVNIPSVFNGCSALKRGSDIEPGKTGQWGIGTRYRLTDETEIGAYYLNYQDRTPVPEINVFAPSAAVTLPTTPPTKLGYGSYQVRYFDDIKLVGGTVSTSFGPVSAYGELTYKEGAPVLVDAVVNPAGGQTIATPTRANISQLNLGGFYNIGRTPIADSIQLLGEVSAVQISGVQARQAIGSEGYPAAYGFAASKKLSFQTDSGLAVSGTLVLGYPGIFEGWDLTIPISYSQQLKGRTLVGGVGGEGDKRYSVGATFVRRGNMSFGVSYNGYLGSASLDSKENRLLTDRDYLSATMKYSF